MSGPDPDAGPGPGPGAPAGRAGGRPQPRPPAEPVHRALRRLLELSVRLEGQPEIQTALEEIQACAALLENPSEPVGRAASRKRGGRGRTGALPAVLGHLAVAVIGTDTTGTIFEANEAAARLLRVPRRFLYGKPLSVFVAGPDRPEFRWRLNHLRNVDGSDQWALRLAPRGQPIRPATVSVAGVAGPTEPEASLLWLLAADPAGSGQKPAPPGLVFESTALATERQARVLAEASGRRLWILAEASRLVAQAPDDDAALVELGGLVVPGFAALFTAHLVEGDAVRLVVGLAGDAVLASALGEARATPPAPLQASPVLARAITGAVARPVSDLAAWGPLLLGEERADLLDACGITGGLVVPIGSVTAPRGLLFFGGSRLRYGPEDLALAEDLGRRITEAARARRLVTELRDEHRRKDEYLAMLGHELRNPLSAIVNAIQVLGVVEGPQEAQIRAILSRQSAHLARLVNDLLEASRVRLGKVVLKPEAMDLREAVQRVAQARNLGPGPGQRPVSFRLDHDPVIVKADPVRIDQVVGNLLDNAVKFTGSEGAIEVSVRREQDHGVVRVKDSGIGITTDLLSRIFEPFAQAGPPKPGQAAAGLGLGLTVVRDLVKQHGGRVTAHSEGPGRGSEFLIRLPLHTGRRRPPRAPEAEPPPRERAMAGRRALVVEDQDDGREALGLVLRAAGYLVEAAANGGQALERARACRPDAAVVDIGLPDTDGYEVARRLRALPGGDRIFLVALSGFSEAPARQRAADAGYNAYLVKPATHQSLLGILSAGLEGSPD